MRASFIASEVGIGLRRNLTMTIAMIITTAVALAMLGSGLLVVRMAESSRDKYDYLNEFRVYVDRSISLSDPQCAAECAEIRERLQTTAGVQSVEYKNPEQTYDEFRRLFGDSDPVLVDATSPEVLGSRFTVVLNDPSAAETVANDLETVQGIDVMRSQGELVERVFSIIDGVRNTTFSIAAVQALATILLIANMIQIAAFTRRTEVGIMRLVGASRWYTQLPFLLEAVVASLIGSAVAIGGLCAVKAYFLDAVLSTMYRANLVAPVTYADIVLVAPFLVLSGVAVSAVTAWATLRLYVRF